MTNWALKIIAKVDKIIHHHANHSDVLSTILQFKLNFCYAYVLNDFIFYYF